jgi:hypothetical protein
LTGVFISEGGKKMRMEKVRNVDQELSISQINIIIMDSLKVGKEMGMEHSKHSLNKKR